MNDVKRADELDVESLFDEEVLSLADAQMEGDQQEELSDLLELNREGELTSADRVRLDELMQVYRRGNLRKAKALYVAVRRGLRPPLSNS